VQGLIRIGSSDLGVFGCSCPRSQGLLPGRLGSAGWRSCVVGSVQGLRICADPSSFLLLNSGGGILLGFWLLQEQDD
jgi:hypothetical protein